MPRRQFAGGAARTTITGSIPSSGGGTVVIASATGWPDGSVGPFHIVVDPGIASEEKILVTSRTGTTLTFEVGGRGADGTVATSHAVGATIWHCYAAVDADEANAHINSAVAGVHTAASISFAPAGTIAATTVQAALAELDTETDARLDALEAVDTTTDGRLDAIEANDWVTQARMAADSVGTAEIIDSNVTTDKIADEAVTPAKLDLSLPRGVKGYAEVTSNPSTFSALTDLPGATVTFTAEADRRYKITGSALFVIADNSTQCSLSIRTGAVQVMGVVGQINIAPGGVDSLMAVVVVTPAAGSVTYKLSAARQTGGGTLTTTIDGTRPDFIVVEDIGAS